MKQTAIILLVILAIFSAVGCDGNGPAAGEDVTARIKAMPAEERFKLIQNDTSMGPAMKDAAIDNLPVSDDQKKTWKEELKSAK